MSSYLKIISSPVYLPTNRTAFEMIEWTLYNVDSSYFGYLSNNKVYLNLSELPYGMYEEFHAAIDIISKEHKGTYVLIPTTIAESLWNENTLYIVSQRLGQMNKQEWLQFCKTVQFYIYVE